MIGLDDVVRIDSVVGYVDFIGAVLSYWLMRTTGNTGSADVMSKQWKSSSETIRTN